MGHYTFGNAHLSGLGAADLPEGVTKEQLIEAFTTCGLSLVGTAFTGGSRSETLNSVANCLWEQLWAVIDANPNREMILEGITTLGCNGALSTAGLPSEVAAIVCGLGSSVWEKVQNRAASALNDIYWERGEDRPASEGGGHTLVDAAGQVVLVACTNPSMAGGYEYVVPAGACPSDEPAESGSATATPSFRLHRTVSIRQGGTVTGAVADASGQPIYGAEVRAGSPLNQPVRTASDGSFTVQHPASTNARLFVTAKGFDGAVIEGLTVPVGGTTSAGTVILAVTPVTPADDTKKGEGVAKPWYKSPWFWVGAVGAVGATAWFIFRPRK